MIDKIIEKIKKKLFLIIGRGILILVESVSDKTMKIQITGLSGETISGVERLQDYGVESYPDKGEVVILAPGGNRDQAIVICVHDREGRPKNLAEKDVRIYSNHGNEIRLESLGITIKTGDAATWLPNIIPSCIFSKTPHGGPLAGIIKLKGE